MKQKHFLISLAVLATGISVGAQRQCQDHFSNLTRVEAFH